MDDEVIVQVSLPKIRSVWIRSMSQNHAMYLVFRCISDLVFRLRLLKPDSIGYVRHRNPGDLIAKYISP